MHFERSLAKWGFESPLVW